MPPTKVTLTFALHRCSTPGFITHSRCQAKQTNAEIRAGSKQNAARSERAVVTHLTFINSTVSSYFKRPLTAYTNALKCLFLAHQATMMDSKELF